MIQQSTRKKSTSGYSKFILKTGWPTYNLSFSNNFWSPYNQNMHNERENALPDFKENTRRHKKKMPIISELDIWSQTQSLWSKHTSQKCQKDCTKFTSFSKTEPFHFKPGLLLKQQHTCKDQKIEPYIGTLWPLPRISADMDCNSKILNRKDLAIQIICQAKLLSSQWCQRLHKSQSCARWECLTCRITETNFFSLRLNQFSQLDCHYSNS